MSWNLTLETQSNLVRDDITVEDFVEDFEFLTVEDYVADYVHNRKATTLWPVLLIVLMNVHDFVVL